MLRNREQQLQETKPKIRKLQFPQGEEKKNPKNTGRAQILSNEKWGLRELRME